MKKGLLLSVVASTMIFAGGDIAPVEPAAPASADFWGQIGFAYQAQDFDAPGLKFGDKANNNFSATAVLGVEKELAYGFGFGVELAGWSDFGLDIAANPRVTTWDGDPTSAEVSQAYLTYTFGNTAIKAGRQALPAAVSPWAWSDRTAGVLDTTFEGVVIANTDLADTTLVAAWIANGINQDYTVHIGNGKIDGLYMLTAVNKSLANTTLTVAGYYVPKFFSPDAAWSVWGTAETSFDGVKAGLQLAYVDGDITGADTTIAAAAKVGSSWGDFDATLIAGYINDGSYTLNLGGTSAFWTDNEEAGDVYGVSQWAVLVKAGYKLPYGKVYGSLGYWDFDEDVTHTKDKAWGARLGYKFTVTGVNAKVEYRYRDETIVGAPNNKRQRVRVEAYYKF